jgi:hypothetical protein
MKFPTHDLTKKKKNSKLRPHCAAVGCTSKFYSNKDNSPKVYLRMENLLDILLNEKC